VTDSLIITKIGGSVITYKKSPTPKPKLDEIQRISKEIAEAYKRMESGLIIVHGAGSFGHPIVKETSIAKGIRNKKQLVDFAKTQRLQNELNSMYVTKGLINNDLPAIPCQASAHAIMRNRKLFKMDTQAIKGFIDIGLIPVLYGVPAYDVKQHCSILSGDDIALYLAVELNAKQIIFGTDVDGVRTGNPKDPNTKTITLINGKNFEKVIGILLATDKETDATGGMLRKVFRAGEASSYSTESMIVNASKPEILKKSLEGEQIGTLVRDVPENTLNDANRILKETGHVLARAL